MAWKRSRRQAAGLNAGVAGLAMLAACAAFTGRIVFPGLDDIGSCIWATAMAAISFAVTTILLVDEVPKHPKECLAYGTMLGLVAGILAIATTLVAFYVPLFGFTALLNLEVWIPGLAFFVPLGILLSFGRYWRLLRR